MCQSLDVLHVEIAKLELRATDCLLVRLREPVTHAQLRDLAHELSRTLPDGVQCLLLTVDAELTVVRKGETLFDGTDL